MFNAIRTMADSGYRPSREPLVQQKLPEFYSDLLDIAKSVGVEPRVAKAWTNVAETLYPGMLSGWRDTNSRIATPQDPVSTAFNASTWAGLQLTSLDPNRPAQFAMMDYSDAVKKGRKDLSEFFNDNQNRSVESTMAQVLKSRNEEKEAFKKVKDTYDAMIELGMSPREASRRLAESKVMTGEQLAAVKKDKFRTQVINKSSLDQFEKREMQGKDKTEKAEVKDKWKQVRKILGPVVQDLKRTDESDTNEEDDE